MNIQMNFSQNLDMLSQEGTLAMTTLSFDSRGRSITAKSSEIYGIDAKIIETLDVLLGFQWL